MVGFFKLFLSQCTTPYFMILLRIFLLIIFFLFKKSIISFIFLSFLKIDSHTKLNHHINFILTYFNDFFSFNLNFIQKRNFIHKNFQPGIIPYTHHIYHITLGVKNSIFFSRRIYFFKKIIFWNIYFMMYGRSCY